MQYYPLISCYVNDYAWISLTAQRRIVWQNAGRDGSPFEESREVSRQNRLYDSGSAASS